MFVTHEVRWPRARISGLPSLVVRGHCAEVPTYAFRFGFGGHVRLVPDSVDRTGRVLFQGSEDGLQVPLGRATLGDEFEGHVVGRAGGKAVDQHAGDLVTCDDTVRGASRVAGVALQRCDCQLVTVVIVEPAGTNDRVGVAAGPDEAFATSLPVVRAAAPGNPDGRHECDAHAAAAKGLEDVFNGSIVDCFGRFGVTVRTALGEDDGIDVGHSVGEGFGPGQFAHNVYGYNPLQAGIAFFPITVVNFFVALAVPRLTHRFGNASLLAAGLALTLAAALLVAVVLIVPTERAARRNSRTMP